MDRSRDDLVAFDRQAAEQGGWLPEQVGPPPLPQHGRAGRPPLPPTGPMARSPLCFTRSVAGTTGYLSLSFPSDLGEGAGNDYTIEINASHDDRGGC
jgi:hypothetical protein